MKNGNSPRLLSAFALTACFVVAAPSTWGQTGDKDAPRLWIKTPLKTKLTVKSFSGWEALGKGFAYTATVEAGQPLDLRHLIGIKVTFGAAINHGVTRYINGFVLKATSSNQPWDKKRQYELEVRPWTALLRRTADCVVFHDLSYPAIVKRVFSRYRFSSYRAALTSAYATRELTVQYRETDRNFVDRLLEQVGIYSYFEHGPRDHVLVLVDSNKVHRPFTNYEAFSAKAKEPSHKIASWSSWQKLVGGRYQLKDHNLDRPRATNKVLTAVGKGVVHPFNKLTIFDFPGEFMDHKEGRLVTRLRMEEIAAERLRIEGTSPSAGILTGRRIIVEGLSRRESARRGKAPQVYLVTYTNLSITSEGANTTFHAIPLGVQYRPPRETPKPVIQGVQTATVVAQSDKRVSAQRQDRIRLRFHWARQGKKRGDQTAWVRMLGPVPGRPDGERPVVGQEVMVSFLEGDPDRPIVLWPAVKPGTRP